MARKRVARGAGVKAKVALAALSGGSPTQIASRFGVHPTQVATWKKRLVEGAEELFADQLRKQHSGPRTPPGLKYPSELCSRW